MQHSTSPRKPTRFIRALAITAVAAISLTACAATGSGSSSGDVEQVLTYGINGAVPVLHAGQTQGNVGITVNALIHRGLLSYDADGQIIAGLAEEWEVVDPSTYRFTLREGLTFQDGSPVTSANVKNSLEYYTTADSGANAIFQQISDIEVDGDLGVTISLSANNSSFISYLALADTAIVPDSALDPEAVNDIGAGPFELTEQTEGVSTIFTKFDGYYGADDVELEQVEAVYYTDGAARVNALLSGDVDLIDYVPWESFSQVEDDPALTLDAQVGPFLMALFNTTSGPFAEAKVREAVAFAINRENIVETVLLGNGQPTYGVIVPEGGEYDTADATAMYEYDPEHAKELLAEAGYPDGFSVNISTSSQHAFLQDTAISMQSDLAAIGVELTFDGSDFASLVEKLNNGTYDLAVSGGVGAVTDPSWLTRFVGGAPSFEHSYGYSNADLTNALETGNSSGDADEVRASFDDAFMIIKEDVPMLFLAQRAQGYAFSNGVEGFSNIPGFTTNQSGVTIADVHMVAG